MVDHGGAPQHGDVDPRAADMYRLHVCNRWTQQKIGEHYGIDQSTVSYHLERHKAAMPPIDLDAMRQASLELVKDIQRRAYEIAELAGAPVTSGKDGDVVYDPEGNAIVRDYSGRIAALKLAAEMDRDVRKLLGTDSASRVEVSGSVRYEVAGVDLDQLS